MRAHRHRREHVGLGFRLLRNRARLLPFGRLQRVVLISRLSFPLLFLHFHEHAVQLFHFLYALPVLFLHFLLHLLFVFWLRVALLDGASERLGPPGRRDLVHGVCIDVVRHIWRVELSQAVADLFLLRKLQEVLETIPLFVALVDGLVGVGLLARSLLDCRLVRWSRIAVLEQGLASPRIESYLGIQVHRLIVLNTASLAFVGVVVARLQLGRAGLGELLAGQLGVD